MCSPWCGRRETGTESVWLPGALGRASGYTRGLRTEAGSTLFAGHVPSADASVVARLREAGAVIKRAA